MRTIRITPPKSRLFIQSFENIDTSKAFVRSPAFRTTNLDSFLDSLEWERKSRLFQRETGDLIALSVKRNRRLNLNDRKGVLAQSGGREPILIAHFAHKLSCLYVDGQLTNLIILVKPDVGLEYLGLNSDLDGYCLGLLQQLDDLLVLIVVAGRRPTKRVVESLRLEPPLVQHALYSGRAFVEKELNYFDVVPGQRPADRHLSVESILHIHIRASFDQQPYDFDVTLVAGK